MFYRVPDRLNTRTTLSGSADAIRLLKYVDNEFVDGTD